MDICSIAASILAGAPLASAPGGEPADYTLVVLRAGAPEALSEQTLQDAMAGHFANMGRLANEGVLLVAGPLGEPRADPAHRGIFLFGVDDAKRAEELTKSDPSVAAGVFTYEIHPWCSTSAVDRLPELERAARQARVARDPATADAWEGRPYVLASTPDGEDVWQWLAPRLEAGEVLFAGRLDRGERARVLCAIDAVGIEQAHTILTPLEGEPVVDWTLSPWYGAAVLVEVPRLSLRSDGPTFEILTLPEEGSMAAFRPAFEKHVAVFGIQIVATSGTTDRALLHAAHLLAQYVDNDEDGVPDDERVTRVLAEMGAFLAMTQTQRDFERLDVDFERLHEAGFTIGQDLYGEETLPDGPPHVRVAGRFDAALEEVWHLVSFGYALVYPETFGFDPGSALADAMDLARGGRFEGLPEKYPDEAWYHYDDRTCDYGCQVAEYFYWTLVSHLGGQDYPGRADDILIEWELATPDLVRERDKAVFALLTDPRFRLPERLPDGGYRD